MIKCRGFATHLHLDVQDTSPSLFRNVLDGLDTRAVEVAAELRVLDKSTFIY